MIVALVAAVFLSWLLSLVALLYVSIRYGEAMVSMLGGVLKQATDERAHLLTRIQHPDSALTFTPAPGAETRPGRSTPRAQLEHHEEQARVERAAGIDQALAARGIAIPDEVSVPDIATRAGNGFPHETA